MNQQAPLRYFDRDFQVESVKLMPGQFHAARGAGSEALALMTSVAASAAFAAAHRATARIAATRTMSPLKCRQRAAPPDPPGCARYIIPVSTALI